MEKNKDHDVNAMEMFKECHTSKKNGMTDQVKETLVSPYTSLMDGLCTYVSLYSELVAGCDYHMPQFVWCVWMVLSLLVKLLEGTKIDCWLGLKYIEKMVIHAYTYISSYMLAEMESACIHIYAAIYAVYILICNMVVYTYILVTWIIWCSLMIGLSCNMDYLMFSISFLETWFLYK